MAISRLRLELAGWFAAAVLVAVSAVDLGLTAYLRRQATERFNADLKEAASGLLVAVRQEEKAGADPVGATTDALSEWPATPDAFAVYAANGATLGSRGDSAMVNLISLPTSADGELWERRARPEGHVRLTSATDAKPEPITVVAARRTAELREYAELLNGWLLFSIPGVTVAALVAGYFLARRALKPLASVTERIATIDPSDLGVRLPIRTPPDEIDALAEHFNSLLAKVAELRRQNREFLSRVAHQLRTPLTLVRGESGLGLERERDLKEYQAILTRIGRAADQMSQRVNDLFLLARAESGDRPPLTDEVELDALALECTDLMRGRAQQMGRSLALDRVGDETVHGNAPLLREVLLELLENAIRHGGGETPVRVSAYAADSQAHLAVASSGPAVAASNGAPGDGRGLGLSIVAWIAGAHHGSVDLSRTDGVNTFTFSWPRQSPS